MKNIKYIITFLSIALVFSSCEKENYEFGDLVTPTNMVITTSNIPSLISIDSYRMFIFISDDMILVILFITPTSSIPLSFSSVKKAMAWSLFHLVLMMR